MKIIKRLFRKLYRREKLSPLKNELKNLEKNLRETDDHMEEVERDFWEQGGICCSRCGIRGWVELEDKQSRRRDRVKQIQNRLTNSQK